MLVEQVKAEIAEEIHLVKAQIAKEKREWLDTFVGRQVMKDFDRHGTFAGTIEKVDDDSLCHIIYEDGDSEKMALADAEEILVALSQQHKPSASRPQRAKDRYLKEHVGVPGEFWHMTGADAEALYLGVIYAKNTWKSKGKMLRGYTVRFHDGDKWDLTRTEIEKYLIDADEVKELLSSEAASDGESTVDQSEKEASSVPIAESTEVIDIDGIDDHEGGSKEGEDDHMDMVIDDNEWRGSPADGYLHV